MRRDGGWATCMAQLFEPVCLRKFVVSSWTPLVSSACISNHDIETTNICDETQEPGRDTDNLSAPVPHRTDEPSLCTNIDHITLIAHLVGRVLCSVLHSPDSIAVELDGMLLAADSLRVWFASIAVTCMLSEFVLYNPVLFHCHAFLDGTDKLNAHYNRWRRFKRTTGVVS